MEEYKNELLDEFVGRNVWMKRLSAADPNDEFVRELAENPMGSLNQLLQSITHAGVLVSYDRVGVSVQLIDKEAQPFFVPWGAVIEISLVGDRSTQVEGDEEA